MQPPLQALLGLFAGYARRDDLRGDPPRAGILLPPRFALRRSGGGRGDDLARRRQADRRRDRPGPRGGFLLRDDHHQRPAALRREPCRQHLGQPRRLREVPRNDPRRRHVRASGAQHRRLRPSASERQYGGEQVQLGTCGRDDRIREAESRHREHFDQFLHTFPRCRRPDDYARTARTGDRHRDPDEARGLSGDELRFGAGADAAQPLQAPLLGHELHLCRPYARQLLGRAAGHLRRLRALHGGRDERRVQLPARHHPRGVETAALRPPADSRRPCCRMSPGGGGGGGGGAPAAPPGGGGGARAHPPPAPRRAPCRKAPQSSSPIRPRITTEAQPMPNSGGM